DAPLPPEPVELVDVGAAEVRLEGLVDVGDRYALLQDLVAIDVGVDLRHAGPEHGGEARELGALAGRLHELLHVLVEEGDVAPFAVLEVEGEAAGRAEAGDLRRGEAEDQRLGNRLAELLVERGKKRVDGVLERLPLLPGLQGDEEEGVVAR